VEVEARRPKLSCTAERAGQKAPQGLPGLCLGVSGSLLVSLLLHATEYGDRTLKLVWCKSGGAVVILNYTGPAQLCNYLNQVECEVWNVAMTAEGQGKSCSTKSSMRADA
jgi:hypothetical protein